MSSYHLTLSTPQGNAFSGEATQLILRGAQGDLAILAGHIPFLTTVKNGTCRIVLPDGTERAGITDGGLLTVTEESVTLLCGSFSWKEE